MTEPRIENRKSRVEIGLWLLAAGLLAVGAIRLLWPGPGADSQEKAQDPVEREWARKRKAMVERQLSGRDIRDKRVLEVMGRVPRHLFVPDAVRDEAYEDHPLPIGEGQTISQPYIVALMTEAAAPQPKHRVLEVGTGSGYQAAVLAELAEKVYTIELVAELAKEAALRLKRLGYANVEVKEGDGYLGWKEAAPFDSILVTCGAEHVPKPLFEQLKPGGKMVIPVGEPPHRLWLRVVTKGPKGEEQSRDLIPVSFVPLRRPVNSPPK
jgi:protein-L-isoaspartate(D-aspartate) O-methyltransferase